MHIAGIATGTALIYDGSSVISTVIILFFDDDGFMPAFWRTLVFR